MQEWACLLHPLGFWHCHKGHSLCHTFFQRWNGMKRAHRFLRGRTWTLAARPHLWSKGWWSFINHKMYTGSDWIWEITSFPYPGRHSSLNSIRSYPNYIPFWNSNSIPIKERKTLVFPYRKHHPWLRHHRAFTQIHHASSCCGAVSLRAILPSQWIGWRIFLEETP